MDHLVWDFKARQLRLAKNLGMKVVVLPTEGFHKTKDEALRIAGKLTHTSHMVDCHFAWGDFVRDAVLEEQLAREDQIHTIGCPRFDFYSEPYLSLMRPRAEFLAKLGIRNPEAPVVLWATNTTYASRSQRKIYRRHVNRGSLPKGEVQSYLEDGRTQFHATSSLIVELARRHPDWNFVIKVHPAEWINPYVEMVKGKDNLYLGFDAPIREFLYHCDVLLQRGCTTGTEAWMLNKPVLEAELGKYHLHPLDEYVAGNHLVTSVDEADKAMLNYFAGAPISPEQMSARRAFIEKHYYRVDGRSSERCAEVIHKEITPPNYTDNDRSHRERSTAEARMLWKEEEDARFPNKVKDLLGLKRSVSFRLWKRVTLEARDNLGRFIAEPEITPDMVADLYTRFESLPEAQSARSEVLQA
jgi:surface carbohydrate biosynthesis protein